MFFFNGALISFDILADKHSLRHELFFQSDFGLLVKDDAKRTTRIKI